MAIILKSCKIIVFLIELIVFLGDFPGGPVVKTVLPILRVWNLPWLGN